MVKKPASRSVAKGGFSFRSYNKLLRRETAVTIKSASMMQSTSRSYLVMRHLPIQEWGGRRLFAVAFPATLFFIANARSVCQRLLQIILATLHHHADHARICQSRGALQWQAAEQNAHTLQRQSYGEFYKPVSARKISAPPCRASTPRSPFPTAAVFSDAYCPQQKWAATE